MDSYSDVNDLETLISQVQADNAFSVDEFIDGNDELPTSIDLGDDWNEQFLEQIAGPSLKTDTSGDVAIDEDEDSEVEEEIPQPAIKT